MNFTGYDILSDANSTVPSTTDGVIADIVLKNGIFDTVYLTKDSTKYQSDENLVWDQNTLIYSNYNGQNLIGGNLTEYGESIYSLRLKRREVGTYEWTGLAEYVIDDIQNVNFVYVDRYARGRDTKFEYCLIPVLKNGTEQAYFSIPVTSSFDGAIIADKDTSYHILLEPSVTSITRNRTATVVTTLNRKYPYVFYGSTSNYHSGSFSGVVIQHDYETDDFDFAASIAYRDKFTEWLTNGNPKILKMYDGRAWMISVNGNISLDSSEHYDKVTVSFDFVEIGDATDTQDLYNNGFTDYSLSS